MAVYRSTAKHIHYALQAISPILVRARRVIGSASFWTPLGTIAIAVTSFYQWRAIKGQLREMQNSGSQTDRLICAANQIEEHQKQLVADNKQGLLDNRNALSASLEENRRELANALRQNRDALKAQTAAANSELAAVQEQTEISERPWLSVEPKPIWLNYAESRAVLVIRFSVKNVGKSIAKDIQIDAKMFPTNVEIPVAPDAMKNQRALCDHPIPAQVGRFDLFPVDQPAEREMDIPAVPSAIEAQAGSDTADKPRKFVGFYFVGCVSYHFSFGKEIHQTFFAYHLIGPSITTADGKPLILSNGMPVMTGFEVGVDVKKDQLGMMQELFARNDAY